MTVDRPWHNVGVVTAGPECACGLRELKKARTREAIIDAAVELFERDGFDATTVEEIAAAADVSPRTFFRYFESKLDVVMAEKGNVGDDLEALVAARPPEEGPVEAMYQVMRRKLVDALADEAGLVFRQYRVVMATPSLRALALEHFHEHRDKLATVFAARLGADANALRPHVLAAAAATTAWTVIDRWVAQGATPDRLLPMFDDAFGLLASALDRQEPTSAGR